MKIWKWNDKGEVIECKMKWKIIVLYYMMKWKGILRRWYIL
jgi:hypothetical protein